MAEITLSPITPDCSILSDQLFETIVTSKLYHLTPTTKFKCVWLEYDLWTHVSINTEF